jgi:hypothetical protein
VTATSVGPASSRRGNRCASTRRPRTGHGYTSRSRSKVRRSASQLPGACLEADRFRLRARPSPAACSLRDRSRSRRPLQCGAGEACSSVGCLRTSDLKTHVLRCKPFLKALGRDRLVGWEEVRGSFRPDGKLNQPSASRASEGARASLLRVNTCSEEAQLTTASPAFDLRCILAFARSRGAPSQFDDFDGESEDSYGDRSDEEDEDEDEDGADSLRPSASLPLNLTLFKAS